MLIFDMLNNDDLKISDRNIPIKVQIPCLEPAMNDSNLCNGYYDLQNNFF